MASEAPKVDSKGMEEEDLERLINEVLIIGTEIPFPTLLPGETDIDDLSNVLKAEISSLEKVYPIERSLV